VVDRKAVLVFTRVADEATTPYQYMLIHLINKTDRQTHTHCIQLIQQST